MSQQKSVYVCQQCEWQSPKWLGKCPNCNSWNSLVETITSKSAQNTTKNAHKAKSQNISEINISKKDKIKTKIDEFDQVLGDGLVSGQVILISGAPGIGKSTLLLQITNSLGKILYASGEESAFQIALRAQRLEINNKEMNVVEETDIDAILNLANQEKNLKALIIDSIQTMQTSDLSGMAGSVGQVRECAFRLIRFAKENSIPIFIIGHVTKEGTMAGPSVLAHIVDTVLDFSGDKNLTLRLIKATKNRFGPTDEVGVFQMQEKGLISITKPQNFFIKEQESKTPGSVTSGILQGTRPVLVEIESLVVPTKLAFPKRIAQGIDPRRFELLLAVITKHCKIPLYEFDCFVSIIGGISTKSPSIDLAICLSVISSYFNEPVAKNVLAVGEVGLLAEIRETIGEAKITNLAKKLGLSKIISSANSHSLPQVVHNFFISTKRALK